MKRKCKACRKPATMIAGLYPVCSVDCGIALARKMQPAHEKKKHREAKAKVKRAQDLKSEVQAACNRMIRARDAGKPCPCGKPDDGTHQRHAGHYLSVGSHPALRFHPWNIMATCSQCNVYGGGGKHPDYRPELVRRIGAEAVAWLEGPHEPAKYTREELEHLKRKFNAQARRYLRLPLEQRWTYESE